MDYDSINYVDAVAALARQGAAVFDHPAGGKGVMKPDGSVQHLPPLLPELTHVKQKVTLQDEASFVAYVNRFKQDDQTAVFASLKPFGFSAILDYHRPAEPFRLDHRAAFSVQWAEQWARWQAIDGVPLTQSAFAEHVEENMQDIVAPEGAAFLDLVTGLSATKKVSFVSGVRLHDGCNQLTYAEDVEAKGKGTMVFPSEFAIGLPVFFGGEAYRVKCFLRYRIEEGKLVFVIRIHRRTYVEQTAFTDIVSRVEDGVGLPVWIGRAD